MDGAEKILNSVTFPGLLFKPIRSVFYTLKGNIAMMKALIEPISGQISGSRMW